MWAATVFTRKKWEIYIICLAIKNAKESSQKYLAEIWALKQSK